MANILEVAEGTQHQSKDEILLYKITTTNWVSSPTTPTAVATDENTGQAVTDTVLDGSATADGDVITLPKLKALTVGHTYRIEVKWLVGVLAYECFFRVRCIL